MADLTRVPATGGGETLKVKRQTRVMRAYQFILAMVLACYMGFSRLHHLSTAGTRFLALRYEKRPKVDVADAVEQYHSFETSKYSYRVFVTNMDGAGTRWWRSTTNRPPPRIDQGSQQ